MLVERFNLPKLLAALPLEPSRFIKGKGGLRDLMIHRIAQNFQLVLGQQCACGGRNVLVHAPNVRVVFSQVVVRLDNLQQLAGTLQEFPQALRSVFRVQFNLLLVVLVACYILPYAERNVS